MIHRIAALLMFLSMGIIACIYAIAWFHPIGDVLAMVLAGAVALATTSVMAFALPRRARRARILMATTLVFTFLVVFAGFCIAILAGTPAAAARLFGGLPAGAAAVIYIVGFVPLIVLPIVYAFTFDEPRA